MCRCIVPSSSPVWVYSGNRQTIRSTLPIILRDQHWIKPTSYFSSYVCVCACVQMHFDVIMQMHYSPNCLLLWFFSLPCCSRLLSLSRWMWLMFISISWRSLPSRLSPLISLVYPVVLRWLFYFLSDIPVFPLDLWLCSLIHPLTRVCRRRIDASKTEWHSIELFNKRSLCLRSGLKFCVFLQGLVVYYCFSLVQLYSS